MSQEDITCTRPCNAVNLWQGLVPVDCISSQSRYGGWGWIVFHASLTGEVALLERWPYWRGGLTGEVALLERWPYWRGGLTGEVALLERWSYWRGGLTRDVALLERWPYWREVAGKLV